MASLHPKTPGASKYRISYWLDGKQKTKVLPKGINFHQAQYYLSVFTIREFEHNNGIKSFEDPTCSNIFSITDYEKWFLTNKVLTRKNKPVSKNTIKAYQDSFRVLIKAIGNISILQIPEVLNKVESYLGKNYSPASVGIHLAQLKAAFKFGVTKGKIKKNPFDIPIKRDHNIETFYTPGELDLIFEKIHSDQLKLSYMLLRYTGARRSEVKLIEKNHIDFDKNIITVPESKTKLRFIPLKQPLKDYLLSIDLPEDGPLITVTADHLTRSFKSAQKRAGLHRKGSVHIFRHSMGTNIKNRELAQKILGHSSPSVTDKYRHLQIQSLLKDFENEKT